MTGFLYLSRQFLAEYSDLQTLLQLSAATKSLQVSSSNEEHFTFRTNWSSPTMDTIFGVADCNMTPLTSVPEKHGNRLITCSKSQISHIML
jgi:hypothetical protein